MRVVADTGGIVAAINAAEPAHAEFLEVLESASTVFVTPLVVTEVHHVLTSAGPGWDQTSHDLFLSSGSSGVRSCGSRTKAG